MNKDAIAKLRDSQPKTSGFMVVPLPTSSLPPTSPGGAGGGWTQVSTARVGRPSPIPGIATPTPLPLPIPVVLPSPTPTPTPSVDTGEARLRKLVRTIRSSSLEERLVDADLSFMYDLLSNDASESAMIDTLRSAESTLGMSLS